MVSASSTYTPGLPGNTSATSKVKNHRVVSVEEDGYEDVYDISVDEYIEEFEYFYWVLVFRRLVKLPYLL